MLCCPLDWVSIIQASKARRVQDSVQHPADLVSEGVHMLRGTCHRGMPRGCRPCNGADVARDCRGCPLERGIVGPFEVGSRKKGGAFKTNPSGYYPYSCAYINQFEWDKKQSKPHKEKHDSCALWGKGHFLPPHKICPCNIITNSSSLFLNNYHHTPLILLAPLCLLWSITKTRRKPEPMWCVIMEHEVKWKSEASSWLNEFAIETLFRREISCSSRFFLCDKKKFKRIGWLGCNYGHPSLKTLLRPTGICSVLGGKNKFFEQKRKEEKKCTYSLSSLWSRRANG
jgi:hypothetical protein